MGVSETSSKTSSGGGIWEKGRAQLKHNKEGQYIYAMRGGGKSHEKAVDAVSSVLEQTAKKNTREGGSERLGSRSAIRGREK